MFSVNSNSYAMETERHLLNDLGGSGLLEHVKVSVFFLCWVLVSAAGRIRGTGEKVNF